MSVRAAGVRLPRQRGKMRLFSRRNKKRRKKREKKKKRRKKKRKEKKEEKNVGKDSPVC